MAPAYAYHACWHAQVLAYKILTIMKSMKPSPHKCYQPLRHGRMKAFVKERLGLEQPLGAIDRSKLNVNGSSLAAGHPFAATGGRILASAAKLLDQKGSGRALISICATGGQGVVAILEESKPPVMIRHP